MSRYWRQIPSIVTDTTSLLVITTSRALVNIYLGYAILILFVIVQKKSKFASSHHPCELFNAIILSPDIILHPNLPWS